MPDPAPTPPSPPPSYPSISAYIPQHACATPDAAPGYAEGASGTFSGLFAVQDIKGIEVVYDFATMERGLFMFEMMPLIDTKYVKSKGPTTALLEGAYMEYSVNLDGFLTSKNLADSYSGRFVGWTVGGGLFGLWGKGSIFVDSPEIDGSGTYIVGGPGYSFVPIVALSLAATEYTFLQDAPHGLYAEKTGGGWRVTENQMRQMQNDIRSGKDTPWGISGESLFNPAGYIAERETAIKELEDYWKAYENYFLFEYSPPPPFNAN